MESMADAPPLMPPYSPPPINAGDESDEHENASLSELPKEHELEAGGATNDDLTTLGRPVPPVMDAIFEWWRVRLSQTPEIGPPLPPGRSRLDFLYFRAMASVRRVPGQASRADFDVLLGIYNAIQVRPVGLDRGSEGRISWCAPSLQSG
eukprot:3130881-Pleurochrysis_carterae.AAC.4